MAARRMPLPHRESAAAARRVCCCTPPLIPASARYAAGVVAGGVPQSTDQRTISMQ
ncbi:hypothetical protein BSIN_0472 [Burkholderia singularis]|uniref:Uncharacterized protein n=1 Tax=Burkholderia singularis TaxID=1503053 RepID=A0A238H6H5_9BURK|nr:hypothetical protein BSIN_0472 [Burkholderia singularis]